MSWTRVEDGLPGHGKTVRAKTVRGDMLAAWCDTRTGHWSTWASSGSRWFVPVDGVVAWQPLPPPPGDQP